MGKASSAKKVARAARAGGRSAGTRQRNLLFPAVIIAIVVLGVGLIAYAAHDRKTDTSVPPVAFQDHWHSAFAVDICGEIQSPIAEFESTDGVHTHGDSVIHIHPYSEGASGENATLGVFLEGAGIELTDDSLTIGDQTWTEGEDTCGEGEDAEPGELVVAQWRDIQNTEDNPALIDSDFNETRFREDGEGYTVAFVPEGTEPGDIPKPDSAPQLAELGAADAGDVDPSSTTTAGEDGGSSTTAADGSTTTAGEDTTTTNGG